MPGQFLFLSSPFRGMGGGVFHYSWGWRGREERGIFAGRNEKEV